jgi:A nuclease of the HNH/ENDO VII superfamily with conserved WHH
MPDGTRRLTITDDALPLLSKSAQDEVARNPKALRVVHTKGPPADGLNRLVDGGRQRFANAASTLLHRPLHDHPRTVTPYANTLSIPANAIQTPTTPIVFPLKPIQPNRSKWRKRGGTVLDLPDGGTKYIDREGHSVIYRNGFPNFKESGHVQAEVKINVKGNRTTDLSDATKANGGIQPKNTTWHHHEDGVTMQAVNRFIHQRFSHTGSVSLNKIK